MNEIILISVSKLELQKMILDCLDICLQGYKIKQPLNEDVDRWLNLEELCEYHPDHPSTATVYFWVRNKKIPFHKSEGQKKLRFLKSEIDEFIKSGKQKTKDETRKDADDHYQTIIS